MENEMDQLTIMSPNDVAGLLQIKESTLRKYSLLLEDVGYTFQRNNQNQRWYNDTDIVAFKKLITLKNSTDMNLKDCAEAVLLWSKGQSITPPSTVVYNGIEHHNDDIKEMKEVIQALVLKMDYQQKYIEERDKRQLERDQERDRQWMEFVRQNQEEKKVLLQIAAAQEEQTKKNFFQRLFGK